MKRSQDKCWNCPILSVTSLKPSTIHKAPGRGRVNTAHLSSRMKTQPLHWRGWSLWLNRAQDCLSTGYSFTGSLLCPSCGSVESGSCPWLAAKLLLKQSGSTDGKHTNGNTIEVERWRVGMGSIRRCNWEEKPCGLWVSHKNGSASTVSGLLRVTERAGSPWHHSSRFNKGKTATLLISIQRQWFSQLPPGWFFFPLPVLGMSCCRVIWHFSSTVAISERREEQKHLNHNLGKKLTVTQAVNEGLSLSQAA